MTASSLALGAMYLGTRVDEATSFALLDAYVEGGGVWIDTASCYAFWSDASGRGGQSEALIGRWLEARPGMRERVKLSTKVGADPAVPGQFDVQEGLSRPVVQGVLDEGLERLNTDHVDLYWAHVEDAATPLDEIARSFGEAVHTGKALAWGISNHPSWAVQAMRDAASVQPVAIQHRFSYFAPLPDRPVSAMANRFGLLTPEMRGLAFATGMEIWAYTSMLMGAYEHPDRLSDEYRHPGTDARSAALDEVADELEASRTQVVIAWLIAHGIRPIIGASRTDGLADALAGASLALSDDQLGRLNAAC